MSFASRLSRSIAKPLTSRTTSPETENHSRVSVELAGEELTLHGCHGAFWKSENLLLVADTHFGKDEVFRSAGIPVPGGVAAGTLARLETMIEAFRPDRLFILGDIQHASLRSDGATLATLASWRSRYEQLDIAAVIGNHDRAAETLLAAFHAKSLGRSMAIGPFELRHDPKPTPEAFVIAGHVHPVIRIREGRSLTLRLPCFHIQADAMTLPAIGMFTGGFPVKPGVADRFFVCRENQIAAWPPVS